VPGWNEKFSTVTWFGIELVGRSLLAAGDGFAGISIFDVSVLGCGDAAGAVVDCASELPLETAPLWPHATMNRLTKPITVTSNNFFFK
jgi:hypothetical protein